VNNLIGMSRHIETGQGVPDDHVGDAGLDAGVEVGGEIEASRRGPEEVTSARKGAQLHLLSILPILLGVFIFALNIFVAFRLWPSLLKLQNTVAVTLIATSSFIGLFLIVYAIVLRRRRFEWDRQKSKIQPGSMTNDESGEASWYVKWVVVPVLVALPAAAATVWATGIAYVVPGPVAPKPCIELYQEALNIKKDYPKFIMPGKDPDERRCGINKVLE
jgi:hypothetical protein